MSRIRGKDTTPEKVVGSMLHRMGYRFRLNVKIPIELGKQEGRKRVIKFARPDSRQHKANPLPVSPAF